MIKIENLKFSYGSVPVLENINMTLEPGKIYGLLGENGVGKTTLLTLLCGLKKPDEGTILVDGKKPFSRVPSLLQNQYYIPDEVAPVRQKAENWAKSCGKFWPGFDFDKFRTIMDLFENDITKRLDCMSAGQLKKTYISFCLACNAEYMYMDEPTNGLDIPGKTQFRSAIMKYSSEESTIIISTHQVRDLENIIDPIVILDKNDVLLNESIESITDKLYFDYGTQLHSESLYTEQLPGGFIQVYPNLNSEESKINIEALFNTTYRHKELIKEMFKKEN